MKKVKPVFSSEFKRDAAELITLKGFSYAAACESKGISESENSTLLGHPIHSLSKVVLATRYERQGLRLGCSFKWLAGKSG